MHIGVTQFGINILGGREAFVIQHQCPAQPPGVEPTAVEKLQIGAGFSLNCPAANTRIAGQGTEHHIDDRPQHQVASEAVPVQRKIPTDAAGGGQTVPFGRHIPRLFAIADHKARVVTAVTHRTFKVQRKRLAESCPAAKLGDGQIMFVVAAGTNVEIAGGHVRDDGIAHQSQYGIGTLFDGVAVRRQRRWRGKRKYRQENEKTHHMSFATSATG